MTTSKPLSAKADSFSLPGPTGGGREVWPVYSGPAGNVTSSDGIGGSGKPAGYTGEKGLRFTIGLRNKTADVLGAVSMIGGLYKLTILMVGEIKKELGQSLQQVITRLFGSLFTEGRKNTKYCVPTATKLGYISSIVGGIVHRLQRVQQGIVLLRSGCQLNLRYQLHTISIPQYSTLDKRGGSGGFLCQLKQAVSTAQLL